MKRLIHTIILGFTISVARADSTTVFNEIMYHPPGTNEALLEWVELHNQMAVDMDLSRWSIRGGVSFTFPEGTIIPGGGYLVVASSPSNLASTGLTNVLGPFTGRLSNAGDTLELRNNNNRLMDAISYEVEDNWPVAADGAGVSLMKKAPQLGSAEPGNWTISRLVGGTPGVANVPVNRATTATTNLVPISQTWRYDQSGVDLGTTWMQPGFDDSAWPTGAALLAAENCGCLPEPIRQTLTLGRTTYYFRTTFTYSGDPASAILQLRHVVDDGMVVYLNGVELWRIGMPLGPVTYSTLSPRAVGDGAYEGPFTVPSSALVVGTNVLAVEVHQNSAGSTDVTFGLALDESRTIGGGATNGSGQAAIAINEVGSATNGTFWVELHNYGTSNVPVGGYRLARLGGADREYVFPEESLAPGAFLVLTENVLGFAADPGDKLFLYGPGRSNVVDAVVTKRNARSRLPDGKGSWFVSTHSTPASSNVVALRNEIVINEIMYDHRPLPATPATYSATNILVSITNLWRYDQQGVDLGTAWQQPEYDDTAWPSGRALLYVTTSVLPAPKNTLLKLTNSAGTRLITWYFRTPFVFTGDLASAQVYLRSIIDDGAVFYLNGVEVHRQNMAAGSIAYNTLASASVATPAYSAPISLPTDFLQLGTNFLAVEVHQFTTNPLGADVVFGAELTATSLLTPAQPERESPESWLELYNRSSNAVNLAGWTMDRGIEFAFASNQVVAPGGYLVLAKDPAYMRSLYPLLDVVGPFSGRLSGSSDELELRDPLGNTADYVRYYNAGRWPRYANAAGSSLELRDPNADNAQAEAWAASDESSRSGWQTYTYRGIAAAEPAPSPTQWREFVLGMLSAGEVLLDDISVIESPSGAAVQLLQNSNFDNGLATWRVLGNHSGSVINDPDVPGNKVLRLVTTGTADHMHNHVETTLAGGAQVVNGREYQISFRAKWIAGNNSIHTRLYFNRLARVTELATPALSGTPGARNSRYATNIGPTYTEFRHAPAVPAAAQPVPVRVRSSDPQGVAAMTLWWSPNGSGWNQTSMVAQASGEWIGVIPGYPASTLVQFYVEGVDSIGARSTFPAAGPASRALYKVNDSAAIFDQLHSIRILMTAADTEKLHAPTNVMSNDNLGATVVYDEEQVFYDMRLHLQGSQRGRNDSSRVGFTLRFNPDDLFRGVHDLISIDRSGGYSGRGGKHDEIVIKHAINHAGGLPGMYDDLTRVLAPRSQDNGTGLLIMAKYGEVFLDSQYENGADGNLHKLELIYYPTTTHDGSAEGFKLPNPDQVVGTDFRDLGNDKEAYRWNFLKENHASRDDFDGLIALAKTLNLTGPALDAASRRTMDVNEWLRAFAIESLFGVTDTYGYGLEHNFLVYIRPEDQKAMAFLWDMDFGFYLGANSALVGGGNIAKVINLPHNLRTYYSHIYDIVQTTFNTAYMGRWTAHYGGLMGQNWGGALSYIGSRSAYALSQLPTSTAFAITNNGGNAFSVTGNLLTLGGTAPIQLEYIEVNGIRYAPVWNSLTGWSIQIALGSGVNALTVRGVDRHGNVLGNLVDTIQVTNNSAVPAPNGYVVINEIMYHANVLDAGFVEIHNTHPTVAFDLSRWQLQGADFTFPDGSILQPGGFLVVADNTNAFALVYTNAPVPGGQYEGTLQNDGELLTLLRPIGTNGTEVIDAVRYDDELPWPVSADGTGPSLQLIDPTQANSRVMNWAAASATPGETNQVRQTLPMFPTVWFNEVLVLNTSGVTDNFGQREPWIELFNPGAGAVNLSGWYLSDSVSNLARWAFPAGASLNGGEFRVVWADGQPAQTSGTQLHTSFALTNTSGRLFLSLSNASGLTVIDYIDYFGLTANRSFGSMPDGQGLHRQLFFITTPGAANNAGSAPVPVVINEWMADNTGPGGLQDPADASFQDWFELYNPNTNAFDLSGYYLTDDLAAPSKWQIPMNTVIPGRGYLLVWADGQPTQNGVNGDLHASFQLSAGGEALGLFSPAGVAQSIVTFGSQLQNVSQGRFPDGSTNGAYAMTNWTPRLPNSLSAPAAPKFGQISLIGDTTIRFEVSGTPNRAYRIDYKDQLSDASWKPLSTNRSTTGAVSINDRTTNSPQRFYRLMLLQ